MPQGEENVYFWLTLFARSSDEELTNIWKVATQNYFRHPYWFGSFRDENIEYEELRKNTIRQTPDLNFVFCWQGIRKQYQRNHPFPSIAEKVPYLYAYARILQFFQWVQEEMDPDSKYHKQVRNYLQGLQNFVERMQMRRIHLETYLNKINI